MLVLNKPMGLAVQGGSGTTRHIDGMLGALRGTHADAQRPRLVHRLDKDTAGCLLVAKTRFAAAALAKTFRTRAARKIYWALVVGVPKPKQGRVSTYLAKQEVEEDSFMRIAKHGDKDAMHAVTYYAVVETAAQKLSWISLKPVTGRTHQLRAHMAHVGNPIIGDPKYFNIENWELPGGIQDKLHLLARRIVVPHPRGGTIDVSRAAAAAYAAVAGTCSASTPRATTPSSRRRRSSGGAAACLSHGYAQRYLTIALLALAASDVGAAGARRVGRQPLQHHGAGEGRQARQAGALAAAEIQIAARHARTRRDPAPKSAPPMRAAVPPPIVVPETGRVLPNLPAPARPMARDLRTAPCAAPTRPASTARPPATRARTALNQRCAASGRRLRPGA